VTSRTTKTLVLDGCHDRRRVVGHPRLGDLFRRVLGRRDWRRGSPGCGAGSVQSEERVQMRTSGVMWKSNAWPPGDGWCSQGSAGCSRPMRCPVRSRVERKPARGPTRWVVGIGLAFGGFLIRGGYNSFGAGRAGLGHHGAGGCLTSPEASTDADGVQYKVSAADQLVDPCAEIGPVGWVRRRRGCWSV